MSAPMTRYVLGFAFTPDLEAVALILKNKPEWQAGHVNGIGGKVEEYDYDRWDAMVREFMEETGVQTAPTDWVWYARIKGDGYLVDVFWMDTLQEDIRSTTDELVFMGYLDEVRDYNPLPNVSWLIQAALSGEPAFVTADYTEERWLMD